MTRLTVHPEGIEVLKGFGVAALALACLALRFSSLPGELFARVIDRVAKDFPPPSPNHVVEPNKRLLRKQNRRAREQTRQTFRQANRRIRREQAHRNLVVFDCFAGIIVTYLLIDWLLIPEPYRLSREQRWPIALTVFLAGMLVIFVGTQVWDERIGWRKWTFWFSLSTTSVGLLWLTRLLPPRGPWGVIFNLMVGGVFFLWMFGLLRRIDRNQLERDRLAADQERLESGS